MTPAEKARYGYSSQSAAGIRQAAPWAVTAP